MDKRVAKAVDTLTDNSGALYRKESKVYPREVDGRFARLRTIAMYVLLGLFYGVVWLPWAERQAVLFDLPARRFYVFGLTFWPQDFIYLAMLLLLCALALFFFTALAGRLWCGYACPQTVWTEAFMLMERWTEGDRAKRMKLDGAGWTANKLWRKSAKQSLWIGFSLWTGFTFVGYFMPVRELATGVASLTLHPWAVFWLLFYALATYVNAGILREQICKYMCPYARFQGAMFDKDTLIISYDDQRGEPRGSRRRSAARNAGQGDCIDCTMCVQVCPTGIDIRHGLQIECIACAACIDVCDQVMDKMDYPRGLIRYTTENASLGKPARLLRPRTLVYAALLLAIAIGTAISIGTRESLRLEVVRDRNALYRELADDQIENVYTLRVVNMAREARDYRLQVDGIDDLDVDAPRLNVAANATGAFAIRLRAGRDTGRGARPIQITLSAVGDPDTVATRHSVFFLPSGI